jgi:hypothetical protein
MEEGRRGRKGEEGGGERVLVEAFVEVLHAEGQIL